MAPPRDLHMTRMPLTMGLTHTSDADCSPRDLHTIPPQGPRPLGHLTTWTIISFHCLTRCCQSHFLLRLLLVLRFHPLGSRLRLKLHATNKPPSRCPLGSHFASLLLLPPPVSSFAQSATPRQRPPLAFCRSFPIVC